MAVEIITIPNAAVNGVALPDGRVALTFDLPNGRQYVFPLDSVGRKAVEKVVAAVPVYGAADMPHNGGGG